MSTETSSINSKRLAFWDHCTQSEQPISEEMATLSKIHCQVWSQVTQIVERAFLDLKAIKGTFQNQPEISKASICEACELTDRIEGVIRALLQDFDISSISPNFKTIESNFINEINDVAVAIQNANANVSEFSPTFAISELQSLPSNLSALEALISDQGLLSKNILSRITGTSSRNIIGRCLHNAGLTSVEELIALFEKNKDTNTNIVQVLKNHLNTSREKAHLQMNSNMRLAFDAQWNKPQTDYWFYEGRVLRHDHTKEKIEAWDFITQQTSVVQEPQSLPKEEEFLQTTRLFKGEMGDLYLKISPFLFETSAEQLLGKEIYNQLDLYSNYLWSPDGRTFYFMHHTGRTEEYFKGDENQPPIEFEKVKFETHEGDREHGISMHTNLVYGTLLDQDQQTLATYQRQDLASVRKLFAAFKSKEIQLIPPKETRKPEYLFQMENGQYIYVDAAYQKGYDFEVYMGSKSHFQKIPVKENGVSRYRDGGTTYIDLENGGKIFSPPPFCKDKTPTYTEPTGTTHTLVCMNHKEFDYGSIGIQLEPMNERHTMLDLYQKKN